MTPESPKAVEMGWDLPQEQVLFYNEAAKALNRKLVTSLQFDATEMPGTHGASARVTANTDLEIAALFELADFAIEYMQTTDRKNVDVRTLLSEHVLSIGHAISQSEDPKNITAIRKEMHDTLREEAKAHDLAREFVEAFKDTTIDYDKVEELIDRLPCTQKYKNILWEELFVHYGTPAERRQAPLKLPYSQWAIDHNIFIDDYDKVVTPGICDEIGAEGFEAMELGVNQLHILTAAEELSFDEGNPQIYLNREQFIAQYMQEFKDRYHEEVWEAQEFNYAYPSLSLKFYTQAKLEGIRMKYATPSKN